MNRLPFKHKVWIAGNHDLDLENFPEFEKYVIKKFPKLIYLKNSSVVINKIKIYGSPWTINFNNWAFNLSAEKLKKVWTQIPSDTDILMTHGPPEGILDKNLDGFPCGCVHLKSAVERVKPKLHVFGHIHEAYGMRQVQGEGTIFANASIQDYQKNELNAPITLEL